MEQRWGDTDRAWLKYSEETLFWPEPCTNCEYDVVAWWDNIKMDLIYAQYGCVRWIEATRNGVVCRKTSGNFWVCSLTTVSLSRWPLFYLVSYRLVSKLHFLKMQLLYTPSYWGIFLVQYRYPVWTDSLHSSLIPNTAFVLHRTKAYI
jgi:hypothetical protein